LSLNGLHYQYGSAARPSTAWLTTSWRSSGGAVSLKLISAAAAGLADPLTIVDTQRREPLRRLRDGRAPRRSH
jgi:hypothetical protein